MPTIFFDYDLTYLNTMALACHAKKAIVLNHKKKLDLLDKNKHYFILSGGSNVLLPKNLDSTVLLPRFKGISILEQSDDFVVIDVMAGENWHEFVVYTLSKGWYGLENLALIPGLVGASPIQNIGAYGVSVSDFIVGVTTYHLQIGQSQQITKKACQFGYRDSIFKHTNQQLITSVQFKLHKNSKKVNVSYGDLSMVAKKYANSDTLTAHHVMQAVMDIRTQKLPNPDDLPNCGSFFQNPIITIHQFNELKQRFVDLPSYPIDDKVIKIPAGWLIDKAGLKGGGIAPILTHKNQALVLTNHAKGLATQKHIKKSQDFIVKSVFERFGVTLMREPVWVNQDGSVICLSQNHQ